MESYGGLVQNNFRHVSANLLAELRAITELIQAGDTWKDKREEYLSGVQALRLYWRLIKQFPDFRKAEISSPYQQFFPDLNYSDPREYVSQSASRLSH
jgi:hypothetical protein